MPFFFSLLVLLLGFFELAKAFTPLQNKALQASFRLESTEAFAGSADPLIQYARLSSRTLSFLIHEDLGQLDAWIEDQKKLLAVLDASPGSDVNTWISAELNLQHCFLLIKKGDYAKSVLRFREAWNIVEDFRKGRSQSFLPAERTYSVMVSLLGTVPAEYQWVTESFGFAGNIQKGLTGLRKVLDDGRCKKEFAGLREETLYYYLLLSANFSGSESGTREILNGFKNEAAGSPLLMFLFATQGLKCLGPAFAEEILAEISKDDLMRLPHLLYAKAQAELVLMKPECELSLLAFIRMHKGQMFIASAWHKLALYYLLVHRIPESESCKLNAVKKRVSQSDEDLAALREIKRNRKVPLALIKARIQFDGCLYNEALRTLIECNKQDLLSATDRQEFLYRLARIKQSSGFDLEAIKYYKTLAGKKREDDTHFIPSAALQLGILYEERGQAADARFWYKRVIEERNFEYERSIKQKAKAGLRRLD